MAKYVKLGDNAESFFDPYSRLSLAGKQVLLLEGKSLTSNRVKLALKGGHLSHATQEEFVKAGGKVIEKKTQESVKEDDKPTFESKYGNTAEELLAFYEKTYQVTEKDIKAFKKLSLEDMVKELDELEQ